MRYASLRSAEFDPVRIHVILVADEMELEQIFIQVRSVSPVNPQATIASFSSVTVC
jgi:hypothetical protein